MKNNKKEVRKKESVNLNDVAASFYTYIVEECDDVPMGDIISMFVSLAAKVCVDAGIRDKQDTLYESILNTFDYYYKFFVADADKNNEAAN